VLVSAVGGLLLLSLVKQALISREIESIGPILARMPPNMRVLPLIFDHESPELDPVAFDPHLHDEKYYHVQVGGGFSPYLFETAVNPIQYRAGETTPRAQRLPPGQIRLPSARKVLRFLPDPGRARGFRELARSACRHRRAFGPMATDAPSLSNPGTRWRSSFWPPSAWSVGRRTLNGRVVAHDPVCLDS